MSCDRRSCSAKEGKLMNWIRDEQKQKNFPIAMKSEEIGGGV
jgi:hypothetical protein